MIQVQCVIDLPPNGKNAHVRIDRLAREDANEHEQLYADLFEAHFTDLLEQIAAGMKEHGFAVKVTKIKPSPSAAPDEPPGAP